jgi:hypothetical protein
MRINVYSEEITDRIEIVRKSAEGRDFIGLRFSLLTHPNMIPPAHPDDDSSAVTIWFDDPAKLRRFALMADVVACSTRGELIGGRNEPKPDRDGTRGNQIGNR